MIKSDLTSTKAFKACVAEGINNEYQYQDNTKIEMTPKGFELKKHFGRGFLNAASDTTISMALSNQQGLFDINVKTTQYNRYRSDDVALSKAQISIETGVTNKGWETWGGIFGDQYGTHERLQNAATRAAQTCALRIQEP